ncbi:MAG TPA: HepT-like ribonuclease domain-containing protein [Phycisphaerales bacterium]|nr:HepT-like ribonuclease domain-containing protein [Phycisphaerales bacterium]
MLALTREALAEFASVEEAEFLARRLYQTSPAWYIQAIGEAAARISDESRALIPDVPWRQIVGARHILSHEYDRLIHAKLWRVLREHLPPLAAQLEAGIHRFPAAGHQHAAEE